MKTIAVVIKQAGLVCLIVCLTTFISQSSYAQAKPKGKPWPAPASAISMKNPVKADALSIKDGKVLYVKHCKSCHGDAGKGDGTKAKNLDISCGDLGISGISKITDGELYWKITEGRKPMPTFSKKLTDAERWAIINYMRTFNK